MARRRGGRGRRDDTPTKNWIVQNYLVSHGSCDDEEAGCGLARSGGPGKLLWRSGRLSNCFHSILSASPGPPPSVPHPQRGPPPPPPPSGRLWLVVRRCEQKNTLASLVLFFRTASLALTNRGHVSTFLRTDLLLLLTEGSALWWCSFESGDSYFDGRRCFCRKFVRLSLCCR